MCLFYVKQYKPYTRRKKPAKKTDRDVVFGFIQRTKKGVNTAMLVKKTGSNPKKIANIVFQLTKTG
jgi:hypothetical protein